MYKGQEFHLSEVGLMFRIFNLLLYWRSKLNYQYFLWFWHKEVVMNFKLNQKWLPILNEPRWDKLLYIARCGTIATSRWAFFFSWLGARHGAVVWGQRWNSSGFLWSHEGQPGWQPPAAARSWTSARVPVCSQGSPVFARWACCGLI